MKMREQVNLKEGHPHELCLGIVIIPCHQQVSLAIDQIMLQGIATLGETQGHKIPATLIAVAGQDKALIAEIEALSAVMRVEVAFAQVIEPEDETKENPV